MMLSSSLLPAELLSDDDVLSLGAVALAFHRYEEAGARPDTPLFVFATELIKVASSSRRLIAPHA
jgi:hypothetical protein